MQASLQAYAVPFRRPWGWLPSAAGLATALVSAVLIGSETRAGSVPPPARVELLRASELPSIAQAFAALSMPPAAASSPRSPLPPQWDGITDPAARQFLVEVLDGVARIPPDLPLRDELLVRSLLPLGAAGAAMQARGEIASFGTDTAALIGTSRYDALVELAVDTENERRRLAALAAIRDRELAERAARLPRWWDAIALLAAIALPAGAAIHRQVRFRPVRIDGHALHHGARRLTWEDLAVLRWSADHVVVTLRGGQPSRIDGVDLAQFDVDALQRLSDRLVRARDDGAASPEAADDLAALIGRARG